MSIIFPYAIALAFFISALAQKYIVGRINKDPKSKESRFVGGSSLFCLSMAVISAFLFVLF